MKIPRLSEMQIHEPSVGAVEAAYADLLVKLDRADSAEAQIAVIEEWNRLRVEHDTWRSLVHLRFNQDTENADYKRAREYCDEITECFMRHGVIQY